MTTWIMIFTFYATQQLGASPTQMGWKDVQTIVVSNIASEAACRRLIAELDPELRQSGAPKCVSVETVRP